MRLAVHGALGVWDALTHEQQKSVPTTVDALEARGPTLGFCSTRACVSTIRRLARQRPEGRLSTPGVAWASGLPGSQQSRTGSLGCWWSGLLRRGRSAGLG